MAAKIKLSLLLAFLAFLVVVSGILLFLHGKPTKAGFGDNLFGYAWSENIGWISFNSMNETGSSSDYGVNVDSSGNLSGYAWSENIGWISFNRSDSGSPSFNDPGSGSGPIAKLDSVTGTVNGWARALAGVSRTDGWDGWISLRGTAAGSSYGVSVSSCNWSGWAWGSEVVGWISFSSSNLGAGSGSAYGVTSTGAGCFVPPAVTADIKANGSDGSITISSGASTIITWISTNADSCTVTANGSATGWPNTPSGSQSSGSLTSSVTYNLYCSNSGGGFNTDSIQVNIEAAPETTTTTPRVREVAP